MYFRATILRLFPVACAAVMLCASAVAHVPRAPVSQFGTDNAVTNSVDACGRNTRYALDILGRRARVTYPSGRAESFALDALGRMNAFTNSEGHVYRLAYDGQSRVISATNAAGEQVFRNFFVAQGLLQCVAVLHPRAVWREFVSWLRTVRPGVPPSECVVAISLRNTLPNFSRIPPKPKPTASRNSYATASIRAGPRG
jgi:YD repeat-containing protein